jgi:hypothetical protein
MSLSELRIQLANARAALRETKADYETTKAIREQAAIDRGFLGSCKNEGERTRTLTVVLDGDNDYLTARERLRIAEYEVDLVAAQIAIEEDARDAEKLRIRDDANKALDRYAAALERLARVNPIHTAIDAALPR